MLSVTYELKELSAGWRVSLEQAAHGRRYHRAARFFDTTHNHAEVLCFYNDPYTRGMDRFSYRIGDLAGESFLKLRSMCKSVDHTRQLGQPDNSTIWNVADMRLADKGK